MKMKLMLASLLVALTLTGCGTAEKDEVKSINDLTIPAGATFRTTTDVKVELKGSGKPYAMVTLWKGMPQTDSGEEIATIQFDKDGNYSDTVTINGDVSEVYLQSNYITLPSAKVAINDGKIEYDYEITTAETPATRKSTRYSATGLNTVSGWNSYGVPNGMTNVTIEQNLINTLNAKFIERAELKNDDGSYVKNSTSKDIVAVVKNPDKDVTITVIHDGAGYLNTVAYYTYPADGSAPTLDYVRKNAKFVFPNFDISKNTLKVGDTVTIGKFVKGTKIGFVILSDAWSNFGSTSKADQNKLWNPAMGRFCTTSALNGDKIQHTVMYNYERENPATKEIETIGIIGMEDMDARNKYADYDYNDMMIYVNTETTGSIIKSVVDERTIALTDYYPTSKSVNTFVFEDMWPKKGDYDFNDQVITAQYKIEGEMKIRTTTTYKDGVVISTKVEQLYKKLKSVTLNYTLKAAGSSSSYTTGFGMELAMDKSKIAGVTGQAIVRGVVKTDANGVETNNTNSVIVVYDDAKKLLTNEDGTAFVNTVKTKQNYPAVTKTVVVNFVDGTQYEDLTNKAPFNPFIFRNAIAAERGIEVHLLGQKPTGLADIAKFGTMDDATVIGSQYYQTTTNFPWALEIPGNFKYPIERTDIVAAYPEFFDWAQSAGTVNKTWYNNGVVSNLY